MQSHAIQAILITDKGGSPRFYMQLDPKALNMDPVMASSFFAAIDMFSKEVFEQKHPIFQVDYGSRLFTLIKGVKTNLIVVSIQRLGPDTIDILDSLLAEFELDWLEIVDPIEYNFDTSFVDVYMESFGERVMDRVVSSEDGQRVADELGIPHIEVSVRLDKNVNDAFETIARNIINSFS